MKRHAPGLRHLLNLAKYNHHSGLGARASRPLPEGAREAACLTSKAEAFSTPGGRDARAPRKTLQAISHCIMRGSLVLVALLPQLPAVAAVRGTVTNGTFGRPQAGVSVTLLKLEGGMVSAGQAVTDSAGGFSIDAPPPSGGLPYLVRADYRGVAYHSPVPPGAEKEIRIDVFDTTSDTSSVKLVSHQVIAEPRPGRLMVSEVYTVSNSTSPPKTYVGSGKGKETFRFFVAEGKAEELQVSASGPNRMPLRQTTLERAPGAYALQYAFRPGESHVEVSYRFPYESSFLFRKMKGKPSLPGSSQTTLIVPLEGVAVSGPGLTFVKNDETQGAAFYSWNTPAPIEFQISGALAEAPSAAGGTPEEEVSTVETPNFIFQARWKILIVLGAALALGLAHMYRLDVASAPQARASKK